MRSPVIVLVAAAMLLISLACQSSGETTPPQLPTTTPLPTPTTTPPPAQEWELEEIAIDGTTVRVTVRVFATASLSVTLDESFATAVSEEPPVLEYLFENLEPGLHTLQIQDVMGNHLIREITVEAAHGSAELPAWLKRKIDELEQQPSAGSPISITEYEYRGGRVFYETAPCCDQFNSLYDLEGALLGHPDGGITGQGDGRIPYSFAAGQKGRLIWQDERKTVERNNQYLLAPIETVDLQIAESFPLQYFLKVEYGLPDGCHSAGGYTLRRDGQQVVIRVFNQKPADPGIMCIMVYGTGEVVIPLGSDFDSKQTYTVDVNGKKLSFRGDRVLDTAVVPTPTPPVRPRPQAKTPVEELAQQRALWNSHGFTDYEMTFNWNCFCPMEYISPVRIAVRGKDAIVAATYADTGQPVIPHLERDLETMSGLFDLLETTYKQEAHHVSVQYHPEFGYPTEVFIDYSERTVDEELGFQVTQLTPLAP